MYHHVSRRAHKSSCSESTEPALCMAAMHTHIYKQSVNNLVHMGYIAAQTGVHPARLTCKAAQRHRSAVCCMQYAAIFGASAQLDIVVEKNRCASAQSGASFKPAQLAMDFETISRRLSNASSLHNQYVHAPLSCVQDILYMLTHDMSVNTPAGSA